MEYGCIGEHLSHSFSKDIHALLADYRYELCEISKDALSAFMTERSFKAINVTIPYKQAVIPHLYSVSPEAEAIGAVNTVVNRDGRLYGYNTDFYGICAALSHMGFEDLAGKKVLILGTGGTSRTARAVAEHLGAREIYRVSRSGSEGALTYEDALRSHTDAHFIFNTTPVGMFPNAENAPISLAAFGALEGVFDAVYNPLRTRLVSEAQARGIPASGGLYMLVAQAFRAAEIFLDAPLPREALDAAYESILGAKESILLIGMPASGKSVVGRALAEALARPFYDSDDEIVKKEGRTISDIFASDGEAAFRTVEAEVIASLSTLTGAVIATGGGAVLRDDSVMRLKQNGRLVFLDRPLEKLLPTPDRPTASSAEEIEARYHERYERYRTVADTVIDADGTVRDVLEKIRKELSL